MPRAGLSRKQIADAVISLTAKRIKRDGFSKVRLIDIARDLGVSHAALYSHFANKEALLDSVTEVWIEKIDVALQDICDEDIYPIKAIYKWHLCLHQLQHERVVGEPELFAAFDTATSNQKPFIKTHLDNMLVQLTGLVAKAMAGGQLNPQSAAYGAQMLLEATKAFHHPNLVAENANQDRSHMLVSLIDILIAGMR